MDPRFKMKMKKEKVFERLIERTMRHFRFKNVSKMQNQLIKAICTTNNNLRKTEK